MQRTSTSAALKVDGGILRSRGTQAASFTPARDANLTEFLQDCRQQFGADLPALQPPWFMRDVARLTLETGGIVFTGGSLDPWQGGSWASLDEVQATAASDGGKIITRSRHDKEMEVSSDAGSLITSSQGHAEQEALSGSGSPDTADQDDSTRSAASSAGVAASRQARLAFVVYEGASHCTDTHTYTWNQPGQSSAWRQQRAQAMEYAVQFAQQQRLRVRRSTAG